MTCAPGSFRPRLREGFDADVGRDGSLAVAGGKRGHRIGVASATVRWSRRLGSPHKASAAICSIMALKESRTVGTAIRSWSLKSASVLTLGLMVLKRHGAVADGAHRFDL